DGLLRGLSDDHALASGQSARLHDDGSPLPSHVVAIERLARERGVACRRNAMAAQKLFRVRLRALELRGALARHEAPESLGAELIDDTADEGNFRTHDREIDALR